MRDNADIGTCVDDFTTFALFVSIGSIQLPLETDVTARRSDERKEPYVNRGVPMS